MFQNFKYWNHTALDRILFLGETVKMIADSYEKELSLKCHIKENVAHATDEANLMFFTASWTHQPYLNSAQLDVQLEAMLKETGFRWHQIITCFLDAIVYTFLKV